VGCFGGFVLWVFLGGWCGWLGVGGVLGVFCGGAVFCLVGVFLDGGVGVLSVGGGFVFVGCWRVVCWWLGVLFVGKEGGVGWLFLCVGVCVSLCQSFPSFGEGAGLVEK